MNLPDRGISRLFILLSILVALACDDTSEIGLNINPEVDKISVRYVSLPLPATNIYFDSIRTDFSQRITAGVLDDPIFGKVKATAYSQFALSLGSSFLAGRDATLDSMVLQLQVDSYQGLDISKPQVFRVHQIADTLFSGVTYLSKFKTPIAPQVLGTGSVSLNTTDTKFLRVRLTGAIVDTLFERSKALITTSTFNNFFRGLAIVPADDNNVMIDFDPTSANTQIIMYHKLPSANRDSLRYNLRLNSDNLVRYSHLEVDRSNAKIQNLPLHQEFLSGDDIVYFHHNSGVHPVIDLSPLQHFVDTVGPVVLNRVEIEIRNNLYHPLAPNITPPSEIRYVFLRNGRINGPGTAFQPSFNIVLDDISYTGQNPNPTSHIYSASLFQSYFGTITIFSELKTRGKIDIDKLVVYPRVAGTSRRAAFHKDSFRLKVFYTRLNNSSSN